jgi:hypothetical protein
MVRDQVAMSLETDPVAYCPIADWGGAKIEYVECAKIGCEGYVVQEDTCKSE